MYPPPADPSGTAPFYSAPSHSAPSGATSSGTASSTTAARAHTAPRAAARRRYLLVALVAPLLLVALVGVVQFVTTPDLSRVVPTHWGGDGEIDGWGPAWTYPVMTLALGLPIVTVMAALGLSSLSNTDGRTRLRFMAAMSAGLGGFFAVLFGVLPLQLDIGVTMLIGLLGGALAGGLVGWWAYRVTFEVEPDGGAPESDPTPAPASASTAGATWQRTTSMGAAGLWLSIGSAVLLTGVTAVVVWESISSTGALSGSAWATLVVCVLVAPLLATFTRATVRVGPDGLSVRGPLGVPRVHLAAAEISSVEASPVNPVGEFGGWGWRLFPGSGWGVVMRAGDGLRVVRTNGKSFTVTVDDAAEGAALLRGYIRQERGAA